MKKQNVSIETMPETIGSAESVPEQDLMLPHWGQHERTMPNDLVRSALFTVAKIEPRPFHKGAPVSTVSGVTIFYTGEELRQRDEDVFLQLLHYQQRVPVGQAVEFFAHELLQDLRWTSNGRSFREIKESIKRLKATMLEIPIEVSPNKTVNYGGSLVREFLYDPTPKREKWAVVLDSQILSLYAHRHFSKLDWDERLSLPSLAKWLHGFYLSYDIPPEIDEMTLSRLSGAAIQSKGKFRQQLKEALKLLQKIGLLESFTIESDGQVRVVRKKVQL